MGYWLKYQNINSLLYKSEKDHFCFVSLNTDSKAEIIFKESVFKEIHLQLVYCDKEFFGVTTFLKDFLDFVYKKNGNIAESVEYDYKEIEGKWNILKTNYLRYFSKFQKIYGSIEFDFYLSNDSNNSWKLIYSYDKREDDIKQKEPIKYHRNKIWQTSVEKTGKSFRPSWEEEIHSGDIFISYPIIAPHKPYDYPCVATLKLKNNADLFVRRDENRKIDFAIKS